MGVPGQNFKNKLVVIGWDGACFEIIDSLLKEGKLPNIEGLISKGGKTILNSTYPPVTPTAWTSFLTGLNPGNHGIFGFTENKNFDNTIVVTGESIQAKCLWDFINNKALKAGYFFIPMTYPVTSVNGIMISGLGTPEWNKNAVYPQELFEEIPRKFGKNNILEPCNLNKYSREKYVEKLLENIKLQTELFLYYTEKYNLDFPVIVFGHSDRVQHFYWRQRAERLRLGDSIERVYTALDHSLGLIFKHFGDSTDYIIMSDHGAGSYHSLFLTNNWLYREGYLDYNERGAKRIKDEMLSNIPGPVKKLIKNFLPGVFKKVKKGISDPELGRINWAKTMAYSDSYNGKVYLNLKGRDPYGIVEVNEYDRVRKEISDKLYEVIDPATNKPFVDKVYLKEDIYHGQSFDSAPDLYFISKGFKVHASPSHFYDKDRIFTPGGKWGMVKHEHSAVHRMEGIFIAGGSSFQQFSDREPFDIIDLLPNILYLLGADIPRSLDGKVKLNILTERFKKERPVNYTDEEFLEHADREKGGYSTKEKEKIEDELKGLGYL